MLYYLQFYDPIYYCSPAIISIFFFTGHRYHPFLKCPYPIKAVNDILRILQILVS